uniref:G-protein coupled receptors family 1 profile domain-containing protein n=1 Tax=Strigamia maritima TaxID=126957 RepID=T1J7B7_STRMM
MTCYSDRATMYSMLFSDSLDIGNESNRSQGNFYNEDEEFRRKLEHLEWVAYGVIAPMLIAIGIIGNLLNLVVLTRPNLKGVMYTYLTWLAISDLMSLIFTIPTVLRFVGMSLTDYYSSFYHAHLELALVNAFMACSVFIVVAVTVDRYFSVSKPTKFKKVHTHSRARLWIVTAYVSSFVLYIPVCFFKYVEAEPDLSSPGKTRYLVKENFAVSHAPIWTVYLYVKESVVRLGPTVVLTFLNIAIIVAFQRVVRKRKTLFNTSRLGTSSGSPGNRVATCESGQKDVSANIQEERRLVMLLIAVVVMFVITMTPAAFLTLFLSNENARSFSFQAFRAFANNMEFVNYAMNFYLYCLCSSEIRRTVVQMFYFGKTKSPLRGRNSLHPPVTRTRLSIPNEQPTTTFVDSRI